MNGSLSAWSRGAVNQSCRLTAVNKCHPASVLQSTAYTILEHGTYEENGVGEPTGEVRGCALNGKHSFQPGLSPELTLALGSPQRDTSVLRLFWVLSDNDSVEGWWKAHSRASPAVPGEVGRKPSKVTE